MQTHLAVEEQKFVNDFKLQMAIFEAIGNNYIFMSVINVKTGHVTILKSKYELDTETYPLDTLSSYSKLCKVSLEKYVSEQEAKIISKEISLEHILNELQKKNEYIYEFNVTFNNHKRRYQIRYINLHDDQHVLLTFELMDDLYTKQNEQLEITAAKLRQERKFLDVLCRDYTSVYFYDMTNNTIEVLKISSAANETNIIGKQIRSVFDYPSEMKKYCNTYVLKKDQNAFIQNLSPATIATKLSKSSRFFFRYQCMPNKENHQYFEAQILRLNEKKFDHLAILAFRHIDDVIEQEKEREKQQREKIEAEEKAKALEYEREAAISANQMKTRFLSSLSHDIRTPINGIQGLLKIADTYPHDEKKQKECRDKEWIALDYLESLVSNVLDMNRLESKNTEIVEKPFNMIDLLMNLTSITEVQVKEQGLHSFVDWKPDYIKHRYLIGNIEGFSRILVNLGSNAIKYNKPDGSIYYRCLEKEVKDNIAWFELTISDTGIGMDPDFLQKAFEPFIQKENASLSSINGVGLGLAIVKQTTELMGGSIKVESKLNEGTKYTILLPFKIDPNPQQKEPDTPPLSLDGVKALLVEDNNLNTEIAKFYLEQENIVVTCASNGKEAVDTFEASDINYFDIILMDIVMPIMDGLEATKKIRAMNRPDAKTIPILAMSANAFQQDIQKSLEAGMNAHLTKPLNGEEIAKAMKQYLTND